MFKVITNTNQRSDWTGTNPRLYSESLVTWEVWRDGNLIGTDVLLPGSWQTAHAAAAKQARRQYNVPVDAVHEKIGTDYIQ